MDSSSGGGHPYPLLLAFFPRFSTPLARLLSRESTSPLKPFETPINAFQNSTRISRGLFHSEREKATKRNWRNFDRIVTDAEEARRSREKRRNAAEEIRKERSGKEGKEKSPGAWLSSKDIPSRLRVTGERIRVLKGRDERSRYERGRRKAMVNRGPRILLADKTSLLLRSLRLVVENLKNSLLPPSFARHLERCTVVRFTLYRRSKFSTD